MQQYFVPFSIGKNYSNKVLCDVVEMEPAICYLEGHGNLTIKLSTMERRMFMLSTKIGLKVVLAPMKEEEFV